MGRRIEREHQNERAKGKSTAWQDIPEDENVIQVQNGERRHARGVFYDRAHIPGYRQLTVVDSRGNTMMRCVVDREFEAAIERSGDWFAALEQILDAVDPPSGETFSRPPEVFMEPR